jgi:glycosyltransferase involved in cell wall biosynthesis
VIRLGIDATSVAPKGKGIARVQRGTVRALAELGRHELVVFARQPAELPEVDAIAVTMRPTILWEQIGLARAVRRHRLHALLTWTERLPLVGRGPFVVWLFEPPTHRIAENRRAGASRRQRASDRLTSALWRRSLERATLVLTGSAKTAEAVREAAPGARPLYPGLDPSFLDGDGPRVPMPTSPYVLHVGSSDPRDDTPTALEAARQAGVRLVVVGDYRGPAPGAELVGRVSDQELVDLYRGASAFLDTSLYEGFGYQVLEAMACGTPVVASDTTSIPEVVGEAGLLCAPRDVEAFAAALGRVLHDVELAATLRARGQARAAEFTWERTALELAEAIDEALA